MSKTDVSDRCLIALLQADGRLQHTDLARKLGIPEATVRRRMKRLLDEKVVQIVAIPDPRKIGYDTHSIIGLRIQPGKISEVVSFLRPLDQVRYIGITAGTYDIVIEALFESNEELRHFLTNTLGGIDGVKGTETSYVLEIDKRSYSVGLVGHLAQGPCTSDDREIVARCEAALAKIES